METLQTERLIIRPFRMDDQDDAYRLLDLDIQWAGPNRPIEFRRKKLNMYITLAEWEETGCLYGFRALMLKTTGQIIGICGFHPDLWSPEWKSIFWPQLFHDYEPDQMGQSASLELGIGYAVSNQHRQQGYAAEAVRALFAHAFDTLQVQRIFAITDRNNPSSVKLMQRVGMHVARNPNEETLYPGYVGVMEYQQWLET